MAFHAADVFEYMVHWAHVSQSLQRGDGGMEHATHRCKGYFEVTWSRLGDLAVQESFFPMHGASEQLLLTDRVLLHSCLVPVSDLILCCGSVCGLCML